MKRLLLIIAFTTFTLPFFCQNYTKETLDAVMDSIETNPEYVTKWVNTALQKNQKCSDALVIKSMIYLYMEDYQQGIACLNQALKVGNKKSVYAKSLILALRGKVYLLVNEPELAIADFNAAVKADPKNTNILEARANYYEEHKAYDKAESDYKKMISLDESNENKLSLAKCLAAQKKYEESLAILNKMIKYQPKQAEPYGVRAWVYVEMGEAKSAIDDYMNYVSLDGEYIFNDLLVICSLDSDYAIEQLSKMITENPDNIIWLASRISLYMDSFNYAMALRDLDVYETIQGKSQLSIYQRSICHGGLFEYSKQISLLTELIEQMSEPNAGIFASRGVANRNAGNFEAAICDLDSAQKLSPKDDYIYTERGWTYDMQSKYAEALTDYNTALTFNPSNLFALIQRGKLYQLDGDSLSASKDFNKVLELDTICSTRAFALVLLGRYDEGIEFMQKIIETSNDKAGDYYNLACIYALCNKKEEALTTLKKSIDGGYKNYYHIMNDNDLKNLREEQQYKDLLLDIKNKRIASMFQILSQQ